MTDTTEAEYLEMARHCKELVERKDQLINFYKSRLNDCDDELRCMAYLVSNIVYLIEYKTHTKDFKDKAFLDILIRDNMKLKHYVNTLRDMIDITEEDEEIGILVNIG